MRNNMFDQLPPYLSGLPVEPPYPNPEEPPIPVPKQPNPQPQRIPGIRALSAAVPYYARPTFNAIAKTMGDQFNAPVNPNGGRGGAMMTQGQALAQRLATNFQPKSTLASGTQWNDAAPQRAAQFQFQYDQNRRNALGGGDGGGGRDKENDLYNPLEGDEYGYLDDYYTSGDFISPDWRKKLNQGSAPVNPFGMIGF